MKISESKLAAALNAYIDPSDPEFDLEFAVKIMQTNRSWFTADEIEKVAKAAKGAKFFVREQGEYVDFK